MKTRSWCIITPAPLYIQRFKFAAYYNLASDVKKEEGEKSDIDYILFNEIQQRFSEPNTGETCRYIPTQYLGEVIKQMGFDGVRFRSSLKNGGINIVLFNEDKCKAICSDIVRVDDIELKYDNPEIYQLEDILEQYKNGKINDE